MLIVNQLSGFGAGVANEPLIDMLTSLGLTTNLELCLDAGDSVSYSSGQSWLDRSGNGYDFFRGADGSSSTDDPTFNGSPGGLSSSEYWSFDGGDFFTYDSANETWMNSLHKNNALFTVMFAFYGPAASPNGGYLRDSRGRRSRAQGSDRRHAKPSQAKPSQAKPSQAKPSQAKPSQAKPDPSGAEQRQRAERGPGDDVFDDGLEYRWPALERKHGGRRFLPQRNFRWVHLNLYQPIRE